MNIILQTKYLYFVIKKTVVSYTYMAIYDFLGYILLLEFLYRNSFHDVYIHNIKIY